MERRLPSINDKTLGSIPPFPKVPVEDEEKLDSETHLKNADANNGDLAAVKAELEILREEAYKRLHVIEERVENLKSSDVDTTGKIEALQLEIDNTRKGPAEYLHNKVGRIQKSDKARESMIKNIQADMENNKKEANDYFRSIVKFMAIFSVLIMVVIGYVENNLFQKCNTTGDVLSETVQSIRTQNERIKNIEQSVVSMQHFERKFRDSSSAKESQQPTYNKDTTLEVELMSLNRLDKLENDLAKIKLEYDNRKQNSHLLQMLPSTSGYLAWAFLLTTALVASVIILQLKRELKLVTERLTQLKQENNCVNMLQQKVENVPNSIRKDLTETIENQSKYMKDDLHQQLESVSTHVNNNMANVKEETTNLREKLQRADSEIKEIKTLLQDALEAKKEEIKTKSKFDVWYPSIRRVQTGSATKIRDYGKAMKESIHLDKKLGAYKTPVRGRYKFGVGMSQDGRGELEMYVCDSEKGRRDSLGKTGWHGDRCRKELCWECDENVEVWVEFVRLKGEAECGGCRFYGELLE